MKIIKELKGGSLSRTVLIKNDKKIFVRKLISIENNREFGFYRWFSQYKKIQRYNELFPDLFPSILSSGIYKNYYYFDIEYFKNSKNCYEYLVKEKDNKNIKLVFKKIIKSLKKINEHRYSAVEGGNIIFYREEIIRRLELFKNQKNGKTFLKYKNFKINGEVIKNSVNQIILWLKQKKLNFKNVEECLTHGNITLENILYIPSKKKIIFIDLYEENYIDCEQQELSQLLQSSNSHYELMCDSVVKIKKNIVNIDYDLPKGIKTFNKYMSEYIDLNYSNDERKIIKFFEMSQFIRMLPFKLEKDPLKAKLFLIIALKIFNKEINA